MNKKLKIAIVGAGSSYTPELIEGLSEPVSYTHLLLKKKLI